MVGQEAIWHVVINDEQQGPLTTAQVLQYLSAGMLAGSDLIWRPGLPEWKFVSEIGDFWQPPRRLGGQPLNPDASHAAPARRKWSLWKAANVGLLVSAVTILLQIGGGRGFELADHAYGANVRGFGALAGQILGIPLIFVLVAVGKNLLNWHQPSSPASAFRGACTFIILLLCISAALLTYGKTYFSSSEALSGEARKVFVESARSACVRRQRLLNQSVSEIDADKYCTCTSEKIADTTTYQQLGGGREPNGTAVLKQKAEAAAYACR